MADIELSVVAPMFNEEENISRTISKINLEMADFSKKWELILVNDGSTDNSLEVCSLFQDKQKNMKVITYSSNRGRGYALRKGIDNSSGKYTITIDFDLSYDANHITKIYNTLISNESPDAVIGSPYMKGGKTIGVPLIRLLISKLSNRFFSFFSPKNIKTNTCVLRGYKSSVIKSLELRSDDKELHLEILSKLFSVGYVVKEIPAILKTRKGGSTKFNFTKFFKTHLEYSLYDRPAGLFGLLGFLFLFSGLSLVVFLLYLFSNEQLNPVRPLINATVVLLLIGLQLLVFSVVTFQITNLQKEIILIQTQNNKINNKNENN